MKGINIYALFQLRKGTQQDYVYDLVSYDSINSYYIVNESTGTHVCGRQNSSAPKIQNGGTADGIKVANPQTL